VGAVAGAGGAHETGMNALGPPAAPGEGSHVGYGEGRYGLGVTQWRATWIPAWHAPSEAMRKQPGSLGLGADSLDVMALGAPVREAPPQAAIRRTAEIPRRRALGFIAATPMGWEEGGVSVPDPPRGRVDTRGDRSGWGLEGEESSQARVRVGGG
jgi:hypothetical protein